MKKTIILLGIAMFLYTSCEDNVPGNHNGESHGDNAPLKKYSGELAVAWMKTQMTISRTTPGFLPLATRAFAYSGLTLYESIAGGIPGNNSILAGMMGEDIRPLKKSPEIYWPASANAAMATSIRSFIPNATAAGKAKIDSLENLFNLQFESQAPANVLEDSRALGKAIAEKIFAWASTDGVAEAAAKNSSYVVPVGFGLWEPTPPGFVPPVNAFVSETRTFVKHSMSKTLPSPPTPYSEEPNSQFYYMANEVYKISQSLTHYDTLTVKTWGEFPGNYVNALRYQQICIQLIDDADLPLQIAAVAFAKHGMAINEAVACVFNAKYTYNVMRPITYIRRVLGHSDWNTVNTTPPHPEYPAAHACVGRASSRVLESIFGTRHSFVDRSHEHLYGARAYSSLKAYSDEAAWSRVLGGIHYKESAKVGTAQGQKVGDLINNLFARGGK